MTYRTASFYIKQENIDYIEKQIAKKPRYNKSNWLDDLVDHLRNKSGSKPDKYEYPDELNSEAWEVWKSYRRANKIRAYKPNAQGEGAAIKSLIKLSGGDFNKQMLIVQQSIDNQYQGLFALRGQDEKGNSGGNAAPRKLSAIDEHNQQLLKRYGDDASRGEREINPTANTGLDQHQVQGGVSQSVESSGLTIDLEAGDFNSEYPAG